jgi:hypothetical protein
MIGGAGAKGVSSVVRKGILGKVMSKLAGKQVSKAASLLITLPNIPFLTTELTPLAPAPPIIPPK